MHTWVFLKVASTLTSIIWIYERKTKETSMFMYRREFGLILLTLIMCDRDAVPFFQKECSMISKGYKKIKIIGYCFMMGVPQVLV